MDPSKLSCLAFNNIRNMRSTLITPFYNAAYDPGGVLIAAIELTGLGGIGSEKVAIWLALELAYCILNDGAWGSVVVKALRY
jgi:hypothetical protein